MTDVESLVSVMLLKPTDSSNSCENNSVLYIYPMMEQLMAMSEPLPPGVLTALGR